jgi:type VI secretion system secreted protein VgrG
MSDTRDARFVFKVDTQPDDLFQVVEFTGRDMLSKPYSFIVTLACAKTTLDPASIVRKRATLRMTAPHANNAYSGVVTSLLFLHGMDNLTFYRAHLSPRLQMLEYTHHNQVFLDQSLPEVLKTVFTACQLRDYELLLNNSYPRWDYVCQYNESCLNFVQRIMEHNGLYYYFKEEDGREILVVTDSFSVHAPLGQKPLIYHRPSGLEDHRWESRVSRFHHEHKTVPRKVVVKDYNYEHPDVELKAEAVVSQDGQGEHYSYGDCFRTMDEAGRLARVRAEELLAGQDIYEGVATAPLLRAGGLFELSLHPAGAYNARYLLTCVDHHGRDKSPLTSGLTQTNTQAESENLYENSFTAIPAARQFRPARTATRRTILGHLNAVIDAEGEGQYAMLDSMGRYKVRLPFDLAGSPAGKASAWFRMAQPYAGEGHGMHFPLLKGTEVLLSFIDGNPDRPVIASSVHNARTPNVVTGDNNALNTIKSAGNNQLVMGDVEGREFIGLYSPFHQSSIAIGSTKPGGGGSIDFKTKGDSNMFVAGDENKAVGGVSNEAVAGLKNEITLGVATDLKVGMNVDLTIGPTIDWKWGEGYEHGTEATAFFDTQEVNATDRVELRGGFNTAYQTQVKALLRTNWKTMLAAYAAGVGTAMTAESFSEHGVYHEDHSSVGNHLHIGAPILTGLGAVGLMACGKKIHTLLKKIKHTAEKSAFSSLDIGDKGVRLEVNLGYNQPAAIAAGSPVEIAVRDKASPEAAVKKETAITIGRGADTLLIEQGKKDPPTHDHPSIEMTRGNTLIMREEAGAFVMSSAGGDKSISLTHKDGMNLTMEGGKIDLAASKVPIDGFVRVEKERAAMGCGPREAIAVTKQGIDLRFNAGTLNAGPIRVDQAERVMLG